MDKTKHLIEKQYLEDLEVLAFEDGLAQKETRPLIHESSLSIKLNGHTLVEAQCMPREIEDMAVGFLVSEGILRSTSELLSVESDFDQMFVDVNAQIPDDRLKDIGTKLKVTSGCGRGFTIDNVDEVMNCNRPFNMSMTLKAKEVMKMGYEFNHTPGLYRKTRAVHSAALSDGNEMLYFCEDIGRHNAVDKVVGKAFRDGRNICELILLCTGRFSFDMVAKAARVRIPLIISPAAATKEAVALAKRFHISLCGRVRKSSMLVYSAQWRITQ